MIIDKTSTTTLFNHILNNFDFLDIQQKNIISKSDLANILTYLEPDTPIFLKNKKDNKIYMFLPMLESEKIIIVPIEYNPGNNGQLPIINVVLSDNTRITISDGAKIRNFDELREEVVKKVLSIKRNDSWTFFERIKYSKDDLKTHIKEYGNKEFSIYKTREVSPKYYMLINQNEDNYLKIPIYFDELDGLTYALFGIGSQGLIQQKIGTWPNTFDKDVFEKVMNMIGVVENLAPVKAEPKVKVKS